MYQNGIDNVVEKDLSKCLQMYQKAADRGLPQAQLNLVIFYSNGDVQSNKEKAIVLLEKAAKQGNEEAKLFLDVLLSKSGNKVGFQIEKICKSVDKKIEQMHNSLFSSFYNGAFSTLTYINEIFIDNILSDFLMKSTEINNELKNIYEKSNVLISDKNCFPLLNQTNTMSVDSINDEINEINRLRIEVQLHETKLERINKQIESSES